MRMKKLLAALLVVSLLPFGAGTVMADEDGNYNASQARAGAEVQVQLSTVSDNPLGDGAESAITARFKVNVPTTVNLSIRNDGSVVSKNISITNYSDFAVKVTQVSIDKNNEVSDWNIVPYDREAIRSKAAGTKVIGIELEANLIDGNETFDTNGDSTTSETLNWVIAAAQYEPGTSEETIDSNRESGTLGNLIETGDLSINVYAIAPAPTAKVSIQNFATVTFIIAPVEFVTSN
jgi:hypothetical protein